MSFSNKWNAELYDEKQRFVSKFGENVIEWLQPKIGETILDLGCGTGDLAHEISKSGATVLGIDSSEAMIEKARVKYPHLQFKVDDGETFRLEEKVDAVFSNSALHWMKQASHVIHSTKQALQPGGRFVVELGGKGNIETIVKGITEILNKEHNIDASSRNPWYFPSLGEYSMLLEEHGFTVVQAHLFKRPTPLMNGDEGMNDWLESFATQFFVGFSQEEKDELYEKVKEAIRSELYQDGVWVADYKRLRMLAKTD